VPAEKNPINKDIPFIHQGTFPPAAKKLFMFEPVFEKDMPATSIPVAKSNIVIESKVDIL
jgi:hypothetical protein